MNSFYAQLEKLRNALPKISVVLGLLLASVLGVPVLIGFGDEGLRVAVSLLILSPMVLLAYRGSPTAIPYLIAIIVFNRGLRRLLDWGAGEFSPVTVLSILPALAASILGLAALTRLRSVPKVMRGVAVITGLLLAYGFVLGLRNGIGAAVALSDFTSIGAVTLYVAAIRPSEKDLDSWLRACAWIAAAAVGYGWYQFVALPPWDAIWMEWSQMNSIGDPEPGEFRTFSTMASPGPYAVFLVLAMLPTAFNKRWRPAGWIMPAFLLSGLMLTLVRSSWLMLIIGALAWAMAGRAKESGKTVLIAGFLAMLSIALLPHIPGGDRIMDRVGSLSNISDDESAGERTSLLMDGPRMLIENPIGKGLGSTGTAVRLQGSGKNNVALDNGVFFYFLTFGIVGGLACLWIAALVWRGMTQKNLFPPQHLGIHQRLALVMFVTVLSGLTATNVLSNASAWMIWALIAAAWVRASQPRERAALNPGYTSSTGQPAVSGRVHFT